MKATQRAISALLLIAALVLSAPGLFYFYALHNVVGRPVPAQVGTMDPALVAAAWRACGESEPISTEPNDPWKFVNRIISDDLTAHRGDRAIWMITRDYNYSHLSDHGLWHPSGAALAIWINRHWSAQQIAATVARDQLCR